MINNFFPRNRVQVQHIFPNTNFIKTVTGNNGNKNEKPLFIAFTSLKTGKFKNPDQFMYLLN